MRWYHWLLIILAIFVADWAIAHFKEWGHRRDLHIREELLARYNMSAFRGTKKNQRL
jgi:hypothetical protein